MYSIEAMLQICWLVLHFRGLIYCGLKRYCIIICCSVLYTWYVHMYVCYKWFYIFKLKCTTIWYIMCMKSFIIKLYFSFLDIVFILLQTSWLLPVALLTVAGSSWSRGLSCKMMLGADSWQLRTTGNGLDDAGLHYLQEWQQQRQDGR